MKEHLSYWIQLYDYYFQVLSTPVLLQYYYVCTLSKLVLGPPGNQDYSTGTIGGPSCEVLLYIQIATLIKGPTAC